MSIPEQQLIQSACFKPRSIRRVKDTFLSLLKMKRTQKSKSIHYISPVCAVVGGYLAQEVLKLVTRDCSPLKNWFVFDANSFSAVSIEVQ